MQVTLLYLAFALTFTSTRPGEGTATLTCKSFSGRTFFNAELTGCEFLESAEFSVDGSKNMFTKSRVDDNVIFDPNNKVFTITLKIKGENSKDFKFLKFWAIPSTFKKTLDENGPGSQFHHTYEFRAIIYGTDPRKNKDPNTPPIELNCHLDYQL